MATKKFGTAAGQAVTWTHNPGDLFGGLAIWGAFSCSGCRKGASRVQEGFAEDHAAGCRRIP